MRGVLTAASILALFLTLWTVFPAPNAALYPLAVVTPEISPVLLALQFVILISAIWPTRGRRSRVAIWCSLVGLCLNGYILRQAWPYREMRQPKPIYSSAVFVKGVKFAEPGGVALRMNVARPPDRQVHPVIVTIHGGSWQNGSPDDDFVFLDHWAKVGYAVFAIDYRRAPTHRFPAQLEDVRAALNFIVQHAPEYNADVRRMVLFGRSAGGHLAMLAAYTPGAPRVSAVMSYYGPTDPTAGYNGPPSPDPMDIRRILRDLLGGTPQEHPDDYAQASPITYAGSKRPPTLLVHGGRDHVVKAVFAERMFERLRSGGTDAELLTLPWAEHAFDAVFWGLSNYIALARMDEFLARLAAPE